MRISIAQLSVFPEEGSIWPILEADGHVVISSHENVIAASKKFLP